MRFYFESSIYSIGHDVITWFWRKAKEIKENPEGTYKMFSWWEASYIFYFQDNFTPDYLGYIGAEKKNKQGFGFSKYITSVSLLVPFLWAPRSPASWSCVATAGCAGAGSPRAHTVSLPLAVSCKTEPTSSYHSRAALIRFETWGLLYSWTIISPNVNNELVYSQWNQWLKTVITALSLAGMPHWGVLITHRKYENTPGTPQQLVIYCRPLDDVRETTAERLCLCSNWEVTLASNRSQLWTWHFIESIFFFWWFIGI